MLKVLVPAAACLMMSLSAHAAGGIEPLFVGPDLGHIHGFNEYVSAQSLLDCREFLYRLVRIYADPP